MTDKQQKDIEQLFEAMGKSGGRFVIGQVVGSQTNYFGDAFAQKNEETPYREAKETDDKELQDEPSEADATTEAPQKPQEGLNFFGPKKNLQELLKGTWFAELRSDEKYNSQWTDSFIKDLMTSEYGEGIARDWAVKGAREKKNQLKAYVVGLLKDEGVLKGRSYVEIGNKTGLNNEERTFSTNMSRGKKQPYAEWVKEYISGTENTSKTE